VTTEGGGAANLAVRLVSLPTADVNVGISSSDTTEGIVSAGSLTFTSLNGTTPQIVPVTGQQDNIVDGVIVYTLITAAATSTDLAYHGVNAADATLVNDEPCVPHPPVPVSVTPGGPNRLNVTVTSNNGPITQLQFQGASAQIPTLNMLVDIGGLVDQSGAFNFNTSGSPNQVVFSIHRAVASGSGTVAFTTIDACGPQPTFVGGGPSAWPAGGSSVSDGTVSSSPGSAAAEPRVPGAAYASFASHAAAQAHLRSDPRDPLLLDRTRNGIACEGSDGAGFVNPPLDHTPVPRP
jgi:hypothetical protein